MNIGANDVSTMLNKSSMVGQAQQLRVDQKVKETEKPAASEEARDADPESTTADNNQTVGSGAGATRPQQARRFGQGMEGLRGLNRGTVEWQNQGSGKGGAWLPPHLMPQARGAGTEFNIPYWLRMQQQEQKQAESPEANQRKFLNSLRSMIHTEIQQYVKANNPPYAKKTLREFHSLLSDDVGPTFLSVQNQGKRLSGETSGYNRKNWESLENVYTMFQNPPEPGSELSMVA